MSWQLATNSGILVQENPPVWHSGHVEALLQTDDGRLLVGTETSGVWVIDGSATTFGVSHNWEHPSVRCLATDHKGLYLAGCVGGMYQAIDRGGDPLRSWQLVATPDSDVLAIAFFRKRRQGKVQGFVVIGTDKNVYWSPIPDQSGAYTWISTSGLPEAAIASMVSSGETIHVAVHPYTTSSAFFMQTQRPGTFYRGSLTGDEMSFGTANIDPAVDSTRFGRASLAVSAKHPSAIWAVVADGIPADSGAKVLAVMRWKNAGSGIWEKRGLPNANNPNILMGTWANRNQAIAVAPNNPKSVAVVCGTSQFVWLSDDGGISFREPHEGHPHGLPCPEDVGLADTTTHSDIHAIAFDPDDPKDMTFYVGSDGGVIVTRDLGCSFDTSLNQTLPTLQFYDHLSHRPRPVSTWGSYLDGRAASVETIGGSLQDNGTVIQATPTDPWTKVDGGDGDMFSYVSGEKLLLQSNGDDYPRLMSYTTSNPAVLSEVGIPDPPASVGYGDFRPVVLALPHPVELGHGLHDILAIAADGASISGLSHSMFSGWTWQVLATVPSGSRITSFATIDGSTFLVGCANLRLFEMTLGGSAIEYPIGGISNANQHQIVMLAPSDIANPSFAVASSQAGTMLLSSSNGLAWGPAATQPPGTRIRHLALDRGSRSQRLFVSREEGVLYSDDGALSWNDWSLGLPRLPQTRMLSILQRRDGRRWLYVSTWGWSVWRRPLDEE